ncbi:MAG TPA: hypothetical protein GXZ74_08270 [Tissierellia bacterium]|nr:hypothetical protein [Tissierellia bacterium]
MIAATYDGLIRKRNSFLIFGLISGVLLGMAGSTKGLSSYLYVLVCFYYNGFIKFLGSGTQWKLMWSLPLTDRQLILGKALSLMLLGFGMNGLLYLIGRITSDLALMLLVVVSLISLITDLFIMAFELVARKRLAAVLVIGWMILIYGLPLLIKRDRFEILLSRFSTGPGGSRSCR